jgi:twitching motility two-component system response regulator PilG
MKILIIDDSKTARKSLSIALSKTSHTVYEAENGIEGLSLAFQYLPDILFIDVLMPRLDGFQLCQFIKKQPWAKNMFVCMLTGKDSILDKAKIKNYNADYFFVKPLNNQLLYDFLNKIETNQFNEKIIL